MGNDRPNHRITPGQQPLVSGPKGIGGLMLLPMASMIFTIVTTVANLFSLPAIHFLASGALNAGAELRSPELLATCSLIVGLAACLSASIAMVGILIRARIAPHLSQVYFIFVFVHAATEAYRDKQSPALFGLPETALVQYMFIGSLTSAAIWIPYFSLSKRVHNTFREN